MFDEINQALRQYFDDWQKQPVAAQLPHYSVNAVGWKVADEAEYAECYQELRPQCDKIVETWMNGRWIAKMHLKDTELESGIRIIKLMQRRPGSDDVLGLDHVDFICPDMAAVETALQNSDVKWTWETNDVIDNYKWISVWFAGAEAKIKDYGVLDMVIKELKELE